MYKTKILRIVAALALMFAVFCFFRTQEAGKEAGVAAPAAYTAYSGEFLWRATISGDIMELEFGTSPLEQLTVERKSIENGEVFTGKLPGANEASKETEVGLKIIFTKSKDDNGFENEYSSVLTFKGKDYDGCAKRGVIERADT